MTRWSLTTKVALLAATNLVALALAGVAAAFVIGGGDITSFLLGTARERSVSAGRAFALELSETPIADRDALAARYEDRYGVRVLLFANDGTQLAGRRELLPAEVANELIERPGGPGGRGGRGGPPGRGRGPEPPPPGMGRGGSPPPPREGGIPPLPDSPPFLVKANAPLAYWIGVRVPVRSRGSDDTIRGTLLFASPSLFFNGFYVQPAPWLAVIGLTLGVTVLCWLPLVRGLTRDISAITGATTEIARGRFDAPIAVERGDEVGRLAAAIRTMAGRLKVLVAGQQRFLGDAAHELRSPLARITVSLGLLERTDDPKMRRHVDDLREDLAVMTALTDDLLTFARGELKSAPVALSATRLADPLERAIRLEAKDREVLCSGDLDLLVLADANLLTRALSNLIRNAVQHAPGVPIRIDAGRTQGLVTVTVSDDGPGVPQAELAALFEPFHRPEPSRDRRSGGSGLGLAIVRSAIEACGGTVSCDNLTPHGFAVTLHLRPA